MNFELLRIVGFKQWLYLTLRLYDISEWFLRVYYCHHNARVLADMEHRLGCVLCHMGTHMSKPYYTLEAMYGEIDRVLSEKYDEGYSDGEADAKFEFEAS